MIDEALFTSLTVGSFVGGAAAYLGSLMITRRMALVGDALGHLALPGMGLAILLRLDPSLGALVFLSLGVLAVWRLAETTWLSVETLVGITFVSSLAVGFLIVPQPELLESLIGDISRTNRVGGGIAVAASILVLSVVRRIYAGMMLLNISGDLAFVEGISAGRYNLLYLSAVAALVSVGVKVTGSLLVGAMLIVPPAAARVLSTNLGSYVRISVAIGLLSNLGGILASNATGFPAGPAIILASSAAFLTALLATRVHGLREK